MMRTAILLTSALGCFLAHSPRAQAHCQMPCGIYDDHGRVQAMREDLTTISKAVTEMSALAGKSDAQSLNQLVRWIDTKEAHAERIIRTIADYFLTQRVVPVPPTDQKARAAYVEMLSRHHAVMVAAMQCKQTARQDAVKRLTQALDQIASYWPPKRK